MGGRGGSILAFAVFAATIASGGAMGGGAVPRPSLSACLGSSSRLAGGESSPSSSSSTLRRGWRAAGHGCHADKGGAFMVAKAKGASSKVNGPMEMVSAKVMRCMVMRCMGALEARLGGCCFVKVVDTVLGSLGLAASMAALSVIESRFGVKMFAPPMMASGIIFFSPENPPDPSGFLSGTLASGTFCAAIFHLVSKAGMAPPVASGLAVGALFMWYKATNTVFPPAAVLSGLSASALSQTGSSSFSALAAAGGSFLLFPWLAGHTFLYASAMAMGEVRTAAHSWLSVKQLQALPQKMKGMNLREVFDKFDVSKDGHLDAMELKQALRQATGVDLSMNRVNAIIRSIDVNGDGLVCFSEFRTICGQ